MWHAGPDGPLALAIRALLMLLRLAEAGQEKGSPPSPSCCPQQPWGKPEPWLTDSRKKQNNHPGKKQAFPAFLFVKNHYCSISVKPVCCWGRANLFPKRGSKVLARLRMSDAGWLPGVAHHARFHIWPAGKTHSRGERRHSNSIYKLQQIVLLKNHKYLPAVKCSLWTVDGVADLAETLTRGPEMAMPDGTPRTTNQHGAPSTTFANAFIVF